jgi:hypothetical protein
VDGDRPGPVVPGHAVIDSVEINHQGEAVGSGDESTGGVGGEEVHAITVCQNRAIGSAARLRAVS